MHELVRDIAEYIKNDEINALELKAIFNKYGYEYIKHAKNRKWNRRIVIYFKKNENEYTMVIDHYYNNKILIAVFKGRKTVFEETTSDLLGIIL